MSEWASVHADRFSSAEDDDDTDDSVNTTPQTHYRGVYWRHFWNGQRFTRTHMFRDYPECGYQNCSPEEGKSLCGESIPNYWLEGSLDHGVCKRCQRIARRVTGEEA